MRPHPDLLLYQLSPGEVEQGFADLVVTEDSVLSAKEKWRYSELSEAYQKILKWFS